MELQTYRLVGIAQILTTSFPECSSSDDVVVDIYNVGSGAVDTAETAMTYVRAYDWKYSWTPSTTGTYIITYFDKTLGVRYYEYCVVAGSLVGVAGGAGTGSTQTNLRTRFLKLIDNYNASDLTGTGSSGEIADLCINEALQTIYSDIKTSRYMDAYASSGLVSTADQAYIELSAVSDLDELMAIKDTTNQITLEEIPAYRYFQQVPDPSQVTGTPYQYCRIFNRIYLNPRPTSAITYVTEYKKTYARLASDSDTALIPSKFDSWIYAEARILWLMGEDISNTGAIANAGNERDRLREIFLNDIGSQFNQVSVSRSHFGRRNRMANPYTHLW